MPSVSSVELAQVSFNAKCILKKKMSSLRQLNSVRILGNLIADTHLLFQCNNCPVIAHAGWQRLPPFFKYCPPGIPLSLSYMEHTCILPPCFLQTSKTRSENELQEQGNTEVLSSNSIFTIFAMQ